MDNQNSLEHQIRQAGQTEQDEPDNQKRQGFSGRIGFVLSAAGSAVGLGNIWRFPYLAAEFGGGTFLLVYILVMMIFGFPIMAMEIAIGRKAGCCCVNAYGRIDRRAGFLGWLTSGITLITLPYYCVIGGWVLKYASLYIAGEGTEAGAPEYFEGFISGFPEPLIWQALFIGLAAAIIICGVKNGIELANRFLMPALIIIAIIVAGYSLTLPGALEGAAWYLTPDLSKFSFRTVLAALGQMFWSLSLSSGIMVTFGAYLGRSQSIERSVRQIELFDLGAAFISGLIIIPAVFAFSGGDQQTLNSGAGLMFITLPRVFEAMPSGRMIGVLFFMLVIFAAVSSAISMMEVNTANLIERFGLRRWQAALVMAGALALLGIPPALGYSLWSGLRPMGLSILDFEDIVGNTVITPIAALLSCLFFGWTASPRILTEEIRQGGGFKRRRSFEFIIRWLAPAVILAVLAGAVIG